MIITLENTKPSTSLIDGAINTNMYSHIKSVFLALPAFSFTNQTLFETESQWQTQIGNGNIFPIHKVRQSVPGGEDTIYNLSKLDFQWKVTDGKYIFEFDFVQDIEYKQIIDQYSGQYMKVYLADVNYNLYGKLVGSTIEPFDTDLIDIKKFQFGDISLTKMIVEIPGAELNNAVISEVDWNVLRVKNVEVSISVITFPTTSSIKFTVKDSICDQEITDLIQADFTINDNVSTPWSINSFTNNGNGIYTIGSASTIYHGTINILSTSYHGSAAYSRNVPEFDPDDFSADFSIS